MTPELFLRIALEPALSLLPPQMTSAPAKAMVIAICLQESRLTARQQLRGPARGFPQFEHGGIRGVLNHKASAEHIRVVLKALSYDELIATSYDAIGHNDVLAAAYARLLLWTLPDALPGRDEAENGWGQYIRAWRPGRPYRQSWDVCFAQGWKTAAP